MFGNQLEKSIKFIACNFFESFVFEHPVWKLLFFPGWYLLGQGT